LSNQISNFNASLTAQSLQNVANINASSIAFSASLAASSAAAFQTGSQAFFMPGSLVQPSQLAQSAPPTPVSRNALGRAVDAVAGFLAAASGLGNGTFMVPGSCPICTANPQMASAYDYMNAEYETRPITNGDILGAILDLSVVVGPAGAAGRSLKQATTLVNPRTLLFRQGPAEMTGSRIKRIASNIAKNGFDTLQPIEVANVNDRLIIIDGHHRAAAAIRAGINEVPIKVTPVTPQLASQYAVEAAEAAGQRGMRWR
jgi:ParB-like nuclease domain